MINPGTKQVDVAIIGGGLAGVALANMLLDYGFSIVMIEKNKAPKLTKEAELAETESEENFNARALALSLTSVECLKTLKLWTLIESNAEPIKEVCISVQGAFGVTRIQALESDLSTLGSVVNADVLYSRLYQHLEKRLEELSLTQKDESQLFYNHLILNLEKKEYGWQIELTTGEKIQATLIVGADGSDSFVRKTLGVGLIRKPYNEAAILCNVEHSEPHAGRAFERFTDSGSIAMLPLSGYRLGKYRSKCVKVVSDKNVESILQMNDETFLQHIQQEFGFRLGYFQRCSKRIKFALEQTRAENSYGLGWVLIGNAANTLHPIAAQGFNLGLRDAALLTETLVNARRTAEQANMGQVNLLREYAKVREHDQIRVQQFTDQLAKHASRWDKILKKTAVLGCELLSPLHRWIAHVGLGKQGWLPKLSRGVAL